jgi:hypothetical protein
MQSGRAGKESDEGRGGEKLRKGFILPLAAAYK